MIAAPARTEGNYRAYDLQALSRLTFVKRARNLGFSLNQIRKLLGLAAEEGRDCVAVDLIAKEHLAEIDLKLADLAALRAELALLILRCSGGMIGECRIIDAFTPSNGKHLIRS